MKRFVAFLVAIMMIAGAVAIRGARDGNSSGGRGAQGMDGNFRLLCSNELADVCRKLAKDRDDLTVKIEPAGVTTDRLTESAAGKDPGFDAWLSSGPWPEILQGNRDFAKKKGTPVVRASDVLARSPVVIVLPDGRKSALTENCEEPIRWSCLIDPRQAVPIKIGVPGPNSGDGLAVISSAVTDYFFPDDYSVNDFESPDFSTWFAELTAPAKAFKSGGRPPVEVITSQAGVFQAAGGIEAQVVALGEDSGLDVVYPEPIVTADVQLVPGAGLDANEALKRIDQAKLKKLLAASGWRVEGEPFAAGVDNELDLSSGSNMADPGILQALRDQW